MSRPRLPDHLRRERQVRVLLTESEYAALLEWCDGRPLAEAMRTAALGALDVMRRVDRLTQERDAERAAAEAYRAEALVLPAYRDTSEGGEP